MQWLRHAAEPAQSADRAGPTPQVPAGGPKTTRTDMETFITVILPLAWVVIGIGHVILSWRNDGNPYRDPYFTPGGATACILLMILLWPLCHFGDE